MFRPSPASPMTAPLSLVADAALRVALVPSRPGAEAAIRACLPPPHAVVRPGERADVAVVWWDAAGGRLPDGVGAPLVAVCAGGPDALASALRAGADAAFPFPITPDLLRAALGALARRRAASAPTARPSPSPDPVLCLDRRARTLTVRGRAVHLTLREFDLLADLASHAGEACSRDALLDRVWGIDFETGTNTVDVFVYALRRKLRASGLDGAIQTVRGVGYRLDAALT